MSIEKININETISKFKEWLNSDEAIKRRKVIRKEMKKIKGLMIIPPKMNKESSEFTKRVLHEILPNKSQSRRAGSNWGNYNDIIAYFEKEYKYSPKDLNLMANTIFSLSERSKMEPKKLKLWIKEFTNEDYSKGLQCGMITPILFCIDKSFPIINAKVIETYQKFSKNQGWNDKISSKLEEYPDNIPKCQKLIRLLGIDDFEIFDLFCGNYAARIRYDDGRDDYPEPSFPPEILNYANILRKKLQMILYGPPGTGKTYNAALLAKYLVKDNSPHVSLTFRHAAIKVLKEAGKPMHYKEITSKIIEQDLVLTTGETPECTLIKVICEDIIHNGNHSFFVKIDDGTYDLNPKVDYHENKMGSRYPNENNDWFIRSVTFHQSYSYEDFIEGFKPTSTDNQISYTLEKGVFRQIAEDAREDASNSYVLVIDEINRGNISKIFGELIALVEKDKRGNGVLLAYSKEIFTVPKNLFIVGAMNTADRSLIQIDAALRRRFAFVEMMPDPEILKGTIEGVSLRKLLITLNQKIVKEELREKQIGHSYFMNLKTREDLQIVFAYEVIPLLQDYFFDEYEKLEDIMGKGFVDSKNREIKSDWHTNTDLFMEILKKSFSL